MNVGHARAVVDVLDAGAAYTVGSRDQTWCLVDDVGSWAVFFAERGTRSAECRFECEDDAVRWFLSKLIADPDVGAAHGT